MDALRDEGGCPWDREQTRQSLKPYLIEEAYEVLEAIDDGDVEGMKEELGDLLFQVLFHARIAKEKGEFNIADVLEANYEKMIRRHPHVFEQSNAETAQEVLRQWEDIKENEKGGRSNAGSAVDGLPKNLPALLLAHRVQDKAARVGFDWEEPRQIMDKIHEELAEFAEAIENSDPKRTEEELGDLLFSVVNIARRLHINPEDSLRSTVQRFIDRFKQVEREALEQGKRLEDMTLDQMDKLWEQAKKRLK